ncbi:Asp-tRNA(Asn)/Glu-tRNA(Gln) amidotransferase GatCAB subunit A [Candidatus Cerribacteria bacterium 'Amazon FNV 2010 28 9']|uniref:Glutamyl-tRNA(Gln) amidotransferase subunit A n=1 Tax=Candidatus Cerribacteria bacterium 'Amazon FNV 2010 28 9' TaxID=2081795 RepID=A0A317JQE9_9BACT|nr:MAG: Asp-tRNA(Asn)/Glu-tRNA(Gln) amidotransferase GatCAB subunit A [Candidatus Cerribacteria bacterium 'Amazon FNV 2010 28 9']
MLIVHTTVTLLSQHCYRNNMLLDLSLSELAKGLREHRFSSVDLVNECYDQIEKLNGTLNALITIIPKEEALASAQKADKELTPDASPLFGLPYVLKDSYVTKGIKTTAASNVLKDFIPQFDATVYTKLQQSGAILIGKANMDAWGHGASAENSDFGPVKNPWDDTRVSGGSTGGCAVAIATRMCAFAIGEDTGGSIRNPSAWCGTTGLKVTYGRVSRFGCIAYASSFDTVGPMAKLAEDCAIVLQAIAGVDPFDASSSPQPVEIYNDQLKSRKKLRIGIAKETLQEGVDTEIVTAVELAKETFKSMGHEIIELSMPLLDFGVAVYYQIAPSETSSNLARYDGVRFGGGRDLFTDENKRRIMIGTYALSTGYADKFYHNAQKARTLFIKEYEKAFSKCDVLLLPVTPFHAPRLGELINEPLKNALADRFTTTQNPVGIPSLALPAGFSSEGLPIGVQLTGPMFSEHILFQLAQQFQEKTDYHQRKPKGIE